MSTAYQVDANETPDTSRALALTRPSPVVVRPLATAQEMVAAVREYEALKRAILTPADIQVISGRPHVKKSGWLRIARAFGITIEPVRETFELDEARDDWGYSILVRAVAPNGASMNGDGACWASEKQERQQTRHNVRAHAYTRASNRAISNLVGGGEVSAEELTNHAGDAPQSPTRRAPAQPTPRTVQHGGHAVVESTGEVVLSEAEVKALRQAEDAHEASHEAQNAADAERWTGDLAVPKWPAIQTRALAAGIALDDWPGVVQEITHKTDAKKMTEQDKRDVLGYIVALEEAQARAGVVTVDEAPQDNGDADLLKHTPALQGSPRP